MVGMLRAMMSIKALLSHCTVFSARFNSIMIVGLARPKAVSIKIASEVEIKSVPIISALFRFNLNSGN